MASILAPTGTGRVAAAVAAYESTFPTVQRTRTAMLMDTTFQMHVSLAVSRQLLPLYADPLPIESLPTRKFSSYDDFPSLTALALNVLGQGSCWVLL